MSTASIVSIGNELLIGQATDTNAPHLCSQLLSIGIPVVSVYAVGDDIGHIVRALKQATADAEVILVTGGLGPTDDDLTRQALAEFLGVELQIKEELLREVEGFFTGRGLRMPANNRIQAYIPAGTKVIANKLGTAAGIMAEVNGKIFAVMPGVPAEMKQMFEESVLPKLKDLAAGQVVVVRKLKCFGAGESTIAELLGGLMQRGRNPQINCTVQCGITTLYIVATAENRSQAERLTEKDEKLLRNILGEIIYGTAEQTLAEVAGEKLARQGKTIAVAESCTGGTVARLLTDIPGASRYFTYGWVTYSNAAKTSELNVPAELIEKYGAVSEEVASAMAIGARKKAGTDFAIAITGIAGPAGGSEQKPVGLVYISIDSEDGCRTGRFVFSHDRESIRLRAAQTAINMLRLQL